MVFHLDEVGCRWTRFGVGKINSCLGHVPFEMPFYIQDVKDAVEYKSLKFTGRGRCGLDIKLGASVCIRHLELS